MEPLILPGLWKAQLNEHTNPWTQTTATLGPQWGKGTFSRSQAFVLIPVECPSLWPPAGHVHSPALPDDGLEFVKSESLIRDMQPEREGDICPNKTMRKLIKAVTHQAILTKQARPLAILVARS